MHRDQLGIIGQIQPPGSKIKVEGGDSLAWHSHWIYLNDGKDPDGITVKDAADVFQFFSPDYLFDGALLRHPIAEFTNNGFGAYYSNPWSGCVSRDQITNALALAIQSGRKDIMLRIIKHSSKRLFLTTYNTILNGRNPNETKLSLSKFFSNPNNENYYKFPDPTGPDIWAMMIRGLGVWAYLLYPLLFLFDFHMVLNALYNNYLDKENDDQINQVTKLVVGLEYVPTPFSWLAWKISDKSLLLEQLTRYWSGFRDSPEYLPLYRKKFKELGFES